VKSICILKGGQLLGVGMENHLYFREHLDASWAKVPDASVEVTSIAVMKDGSILGVGLDHKLWTRADLASPWIKGPDNSGLVKSVAIMKDGTILGVGMKNKLWTREDLLAPWDPAPKHGQVTDVTIMKDGTILGIGMNKKLWTRANLASKWKKTPDEDLPIIGVACHSFDPNDIPTVLDTASTPAGAAMEDGEESDNFVTLTDILECPLAKIRQDEPKHVVYSFTCMLAVVWLSIVTKLVDI
jgi:hypothetical protein